MKRLAITGICAAIVVLTLFVAFRQDAPADDALEQRVDALETRVSILEGTPSSNKAGSPTASADEAKPTEYAIEGEGGSVQGPFSLDNGRYRVSFTCNGEFSGVALLSDKKSGTFPVISKGGVLVESILNVGEHGDDLFVEIKCDGTWMYSIALLS